jgi:hypothetical protein
MVLKYSLNENLLTERPDDYSAQTQSMGSLDRDAIINRMLQRGSLLTKTDILAVLNGLEETAADAILNGFTLNLPLFNTSFSISGVFDSPMDSFDPNRHKLNVNLTKGALLREVEKQVKLEKTAAHAPHPSILEVKDSVSGRVNEILTAAGVVEIRGYGLRIEGNEPECGLWFINDNGIETKAAVVIENKPSRILAMIPALLKGTYKVRIITQFTGSGTLVKTPKIFEYTKPLTVE